MTTQHRACGAGRCAARSMGYRATPRTVHTSATPRPGTGTNLHIDQSYIPLVVSQSSTGAEYTHENLFDAGNRIRIIGDPGSGKSSLVKRVFRDECFRILSRSSQVRMPIIYELKKYSPSPETSDSQLDLSLFSSIASEVNISDVYRLSDCLTTFSKGAGLLVLLDGG